MPGVALSLCEREEVRVCLTEDPAMSWAEIARRVDRHPTMIAREVNRNGGRGSYRAARAEWRAGRQRRRCKTPMLAVPGPLRDRVTRELQQGRSPVAVWADLDAEQVEGRPCVEMIYQAVYQGVLGLKARDYLRTRRPRRRCREQRHETKRPALPNLAERPVAVNERAEPGHWEVDQIIGKADRTSMIWLIERATIFAIPVTMPLGYDAEVVVAGLVEALERIPPELRRSLTFDQGSEWAGWPRIAAVYGLDCWFCDPHSPWQRGQIKNHNRQVRYWFPRGTDLALVTTPKPITSPHHHLGPQRHLHQP